jgi:hypothetical protein
MKTKIGFKLDWLELIFVLAQIFFAGIIIASDISDKYIYSGLLIFGAGILIMKKKIKIHSPK